ncbi:DUF1206 domain-containing protein [Nocardiopsis ansamitocini]|uniref:Membrane protein n=1 Tax=Nocardiopsis ansamitocini TaxID=1670832 RepID=A0A9W6UIV2_9ACTN|nr:DUF1206 domain-containing protein [Nocardiopsis ansamitocini]GLU47823.1 membrane protein [Nocardiopsis ansamitocini]
MSAASGAREAGDKAQKAGRQAGRAGRQAANNKWLLRLARLGLAAKGLLYLIIGYLAVQIAFGSSDEQADNSGALQMIADNTGGQIVLWAAALGMFGLALWQFTVAAFGSRLGLDKASKRALAAGRALTYGSLCATIVTFLLGYSQPSSQDSQSKEMTATLMELPAGQFVVGAVGLGFIVAGVVIAWGGATRKFEKDLAVGAIPATARKAVIGLGVAGTVTKGIIISAAGVLIGWAAVTFDPDKAQGLDGTLRALADTPAGPWLLALVAFGVLLYALFCFCQSRWARV